RSHSYVLAVPARRASDLRDEDIRRRQRPADATPPEKIEHQVMRQATTVGAAPNPNDPHPLPHLVVRPSRPLTRDDRDLMSRDNEDRKSTRLNSSHVKSSY